MVDLGAAWMIAMRRGDYDAAWQIDRQVLAARNPTSRDDPRLPYHCRWVWDGRPFRGRHVLVRCYHGLGDTLQYARYLPNLGAHAGSVTVEVQPPLVSLIASIPAVDRIVPFDPARPLPPSECDIEIMELAFALETAPTAVPPPYLQTPDIATLPGTIGLCWKAGDWDIERSIPEGAVGPLLSAPTLALQPSPTSLPVRNPMGSPSSLAQTARLVAGLDLIVTVDTMIAHLAGALNRPTWLLLKHDADWRWGAAEGASAWYPATRLYRQSRPGDWAGVIGRAARDLQARFEPHRDTTAR
ncbi:MAG: hypothetical protein JWO51_830 [Rhodospirillales bacterium]|nr:hypothetical protein [Rhodospirillales bacterium]